MSILGTIASIAQIGIQSLAIKPTRGFRSSDSLPLSQFYSQVTIEEVHSDEMEITDHPVEQGSTISDHAFARPSEVVVTIAWSDSSSDSTGPLNQVLGVAANASPLLQKVIGAAELVGGLSAAISPGPAVSAIGYGVLLKAYNDRRLYDLYTGKHVYKNMLIKSLATSTDAKSAHNLIVRVTFRQILMAQTQTVTVPDSSNMTSPEKNAASTNYGVKFPLPTPNINVPSLPSLPSKFSLP
ncbi:hypothetical protein G3N58_17585 [Paraburkholderia sp. Ac-20342]|uniref:phage baseplate protein n=1 Tax=Paraburkholderia sp. Ac-20342 TaxID=2703889 RepID=UPI001981933F|nr:hypothetical protein [Paraburkholderia sp. Ac-20342]MBN3848620.1 hypothetical protein [Paraburkholderia sp. Ac-20342]